MICSCLSDMHQLFSRGSTANSSSTKMDLDDGLFLPNFCSSATVFVIVLISALLAILLSVSSDPHLQFDFAQLGRQAFFILWISLCSCAALCLLRPIFRKLSDIAAGFTAWFLILLVTMIISIFASLLHGYDPSLPELNAISFALNNVIIAGMISALLLRYFFIQYQWRRQTRAEAEARVQALQSRIRPHFLFNSMNTIASLTRIDADKAEQTVEDLADLFRASLADQRTHNTLQEELALTKQYLRIEALRLGPRLEINWQIDAIPDDALLPSLTLQPILENAIYHGIEPSAEGGVVSITGHRAGNKLSILIENPVCSESPEQVSRRGKKGNQIAQQNTQERLALFFANSGFTQAQMHAKQQDGRYCVSLSFPYMTSLP